jgi:hypothetical protein
MLAWSWTSCQIWPGPAGTSPADHALPSQCTANGRRVRTPPPGAVRYPAAHTSLLASAATSHSFAVPLSGADTGSCCQSWPSQCRATAWPGRPRPTAHRSSGDTPPIPARDQPGATAGTGTSVHAAPSQCCTVPRDPEWSQRGAYPAVHTSVPPNCAKPNSWALASCSAAVGTCRQRSPSQCSDSPSPTAHTSASEIAIARLTRPMPGAATRCQPCSPRRKTRVRNGPLSGAEIPKAQAVPSLAAAVCSIDC